jgi:hypothetical protein
MKTMKMRRFEKVDAALLTRLGKRYQRAVVAGRGAASPKP